MTLSLSRIKIGVLAVIIVAASGWQRQSRSEIVYSMDFSVDGQGVVHDNSGGVTVFSADSPVGGENWILTYDPSSVQSDTSSNEFITSQGRMLVQDWGGEGTVVSAPGEIVFASEGSFRLEASAFAIGTDVFNRSSEGVTWFYSINGLPVVETRVSEATLGGIPVVQGTDVGFQTGEIAVQANDFLEIGFRVNVDGGGDGIEVSSFVVDFSPVAVPEPLAGSTILLTGFAWLATQRRRRRV